MSLSRITFVVLSCQLLSACSLLSPYSDLTKLDLSLSASAQLNPDLQGRPSPLVLQLIELSHATAFEQADYFALQQRPVQLLAPDLLATEELDLRPGEQLALKLALQPQTRYLGVVASYRDLAHTQWRVTIDLQQRQKNSAQLLLDANGVMAVNSTGAP
ncbi:type VI secretion system lipoprotein TssJ [Halopseudomonas sp.]|uniref:type VI secretion system lipoprotein TssJ n=1 Tax=Halopseudomonas sp. TaxID=2901191 RepID=UPI0031201B1F